MNDKSETSGLNAVHDNSGVYPLLANLVPGLLINWVFDINVKLVLVIIGNFDFTFGSCYYFRDYYKIIIDYIWKTFR